MSVRIIHLLAPAEGGDEAVSECAASLRAPGFDQRVVILGDAHDEARCWSLGVASTLRVTSGAAGVSALARRIAPLLNALHASDSVTVLQCWCERSMRVALALASPDHRVVRVALRQEAGAGLDLIARILESGGSTVASYEGAISPASLESRLADPRLAPRLRILDLPGRVLPSSIPDRTSVRSTLGLDGAIPVVTFLADPPSRGDAMRFVFASGLAHASGRTTVGLMPRGTLHARRAARFVRLNGRRWGLIESDLPLSHLVSAADFAIADAGGPGEPVNPSCGPVSLLVSATLGVPVVGPREVGVAATLGPAGVALQVDQRQTGVLLPLLLRLMEDKPYPAHLSSALRAEAAARVSASGHALADLWREVANAPAAEETGSSFLAMVGTTA